MNGERFSITVIDGPLIEWVENPAIPSLVFTDLSWDEAAELCRVSLRDGDKRVLWQPDAEDAGNGEKCK